MVHIYKDRPTPSSVILFYFGHEWAAAYSLSVDSVRPFRPTEPEPECPAGPKSFLQAL